MQFSPVHMLAVCTFLLSSCQRYALFSCPHVSSVQFSPVHMLAVCTFLLSSCQRYALFSCPHVSSMQFSPVLMSAVCSFLLSSCRQCAVFSYPHVSGMHFSPVLMSAVCPFLLSFYFRVSRTVCWLVGCVTSQHASVSQGRIWSDNSACCHTEIEVADHICYLTQSQCTDTGSTSPIADPMWPGSWQGSHWSTSFEVTGTT